MARFIFLYRGAAPDMSAQTEEGFAAEMERWGAWAQKCGPALLDMGAPFGASTSVVDDGSETSASGLTGYGIVEADDLDGARALTEGHPYLSESDGNYAIDIFELMPM